MPERDSLAANSLPFLVTTSLGENATKADVKRVTDLIPALQFCNKNLKPRCGQRIME